MSRGGDVLGVLAVPLATVATLLAFSGSAVSASGGTTAGGRDTHDADGVVYRFFPGYGYQFHPLANFARLNTLVSREQVEPSRRLARALLARGIRRGGALYWEYGFAFGGPSRWTSGFAQAVAAQALARAGALLGDPALERAAHAAFRAIAQSHTRALGGGAWILEYGFSDIAILNAQLQSLVSLASFAELTDAPEVHRMVARLDLASRTLLGRFDTGCWSRYSLWGAEADLHYHAYHVQLLHRLAATRPHAIWRQTRDRWTRYLRNRDRPCGER